MSEDTKLYLLADHFIDGSLTADQAEELLALLESSPEAMTTFRELVMMDGLLDDLHRDDEWQGEFRDSVLAQLKGRSSDEEFRERVIPKIKRLQKKRRPVKPRPRSNANIIIFATAAALVASLVALFIFQRSDGPVRPQVTDMAIASIRAGQGPVFLVAKGGGRVKVGDLKQSVYSGDQIETGAGGEGIVEYGSESTTIQVLAGSRIRLTMENGAKRVFCDAGEIRAEIAPQGLKPMVFVTPQGKATVLGTKLVLTVDDESTSLEVTKGHVRLTAERSGKSVEVQTGMYGVISADEDPILCASGKGFLPNRGRPFSDTSPWNTPIPAKPALEQRRDKFTAAIAKQSYLFGYVPVFHADETTPVREIICERRWREAELGNNPQVRVPDGAILRNTDKGTLVVIDWYARQTWEFYKFDWQGKKVKASGVGYISLDGNGADTMHPGSAGASWLAGLIRYREIREGRIDHALSFASGFAKREVRFPAKYADGRYTGEDAIEVGARIQLDPTIDVEAIPGITPAEIAIAKALQSYGAYCIGYSSPQASLVFFVERPNGDKSGKAQKYYQQQGLEDHNKRFPHIPWKRLRFLKSWNGK